MPLLAPELELRHTEEVRTLSEERMVFQPTGEEAVVVMVEAVVALLLAVPKTTTGAEITISHGWLQKKKRRRLKRMLSMFTQMALAPIPILLI